jgi:hypothetical protein
MPPESAVDEALATADAGPTEPESDRPVAAPEVAGAVTAGEPAAAAPVVDEAVSEPAVASPAVVAAAAVSEPAVVAAAAVSEPAVDPTAAEELKIVDEAASAHMRAKQPAASGEAPSERERTPDLDFGPLVEAASASSESLPAAARVSPLPSDAQSAHVVGAPEPPRHDHADLIDPSSVSAEFFRREEDSVPPLIDALGDRNNHDDHDDLIPGIHLSPETLARRARLRRIVAGVVGLAGVISLAVIGKVMSSSRPSPLPSAPVAAVAAPRPQTEAAPVMAAKLPAAEPQPAPAPAPVAPAPKAEAAPPEPVKAEAEKAEPEPAKAEAEKTEAPAAVAPADAAKLRKDTLSFLNRGKYKEAITSARGAIEADPTDAMAYLYLGSALQDTGKWKEGIAAYSDCVRNAKKGPVNECIAMGGRK